MQASWMSWLGRPVLCATLSLALLGGFTLPAFSAPIASMPAAAAANPNAYVLRYGDSLSLAVLENEKLRVESQPLRPDGRISFPLVGEVLAGGLTVPQLQVKLTSLYARYYTDPHVVVNVSAFRRMRVAMMGHVRTPRTLEVFEPVRLLDALAQAGGPDRRAQLHRIIIIRARGQVEEVDLTKVLGGESSGNVFLYDGDTIQVEQEFGPDWFGILPTLVTVFAVVSNIVIVFLTRVR